jgi:hypothetical protein
MPTKRPASTWPAQLSLTLRQDDLSRLVPLWPWEVQDVSLKGRLKLLARLRCALRAERRRGTAGHWTYDLARHRALLTAYRAEAKAIVVMTRGAPPAVNNEA